MSEEERYVEGAAGTETTFINCWNCGQRRTPAHSRCPKCGSYESIQQEAIEKSRSTETRGKLGAKLAQQKTSGNDARRRAAGVDPTTPIDAVPQLEVSDPPQILVPPVDFNVKLGEPYAMPESEPQPIPFATPDKRPETDWKALDGKTGTIMVIENGGIIIALFAAKDERPVLIYTGTT